MASSRESWFVCHTRPRCEKKLAALTVAESIESYLPLVDSIRRYPKQTKKFTKPLFSGYVFVRVGPEKKSRIYQQELVARAIPVEDETQFLLQLAAVKAMVASGYKLTVVPLLSKGRQVRVVGGPLKGIEGFIDASTSSKGVVVAIDVLRKGLLVTLPLELIKVLP